MATQISPTDEESVFSVDTLLKYMGNDDKALAIVSKIVRDACAPGMEPLQRATEALQGGRLPEAAKIFHGVRGSVGTLGAKRMVSASLRLEQAIVAQEMAQIPGLLAAMEHEYQQVLQQAADWLRLHTPQSGQTTQA